MAPPQERDKYGPQMDTDSCKVLTKAQHEQKVCYNIQSTVTNKVCRKGITQTQLFSLYGKLKHKTNIPESPCDT